MENIKLVMQHRI